MFSLPIDIGASVRYDGPMNGIPWYRLAAAADAEVERLAIWSQMDATTDRRTLQVLAAKCQYLERIINHDYNETSTP